VRRAGACQDERVRPTLLIVDDHEAFRRSARAFLEAEGLQVVGVAADGAEGLALAKACKPDVVLLDIQLPDMDGFMVAEEIAGWVDAPAVILISSRDVGVYGARIARSPARGFIAKSQLSGAALAELVP
jgi:DNA-binding NarL/FixJ family response regulator